MTAVHEEFKKTTLAINLADALNQFWETLLLYLPVQELVR